MPHLLSDCDTDVMHQDAAPVPQRLLPITCTLSGAVTPGMLIDIFCVIFSPTIFLDWSQVCIFGDDDDDTLPGFGSVPTGLCSGHDTSRLYSTSPFAQNQCGICWKQHAVR